jgi:hypothetical protein
VLVFGPIIRMTSGRWLASCELAVDGAPLKLEANRTAEIDIKASARAIWSAEAWIDLFRFFFMCALLPDGSDIALRCPNTPVRRPYLS